MAEEGAEDHSIQKTDVMNVERLAIMLMTVQGIEVSVVAEDTQGNVSVYLK